LHKIEPIIINRFSSFNC